MPPALRFLAVLASLMGAGGVALAALSTHASGGELGRTASLFLLLHAAAVVAVCAYARAGDVGALFAGYGLALGALVFSGDLTSRAYEGARLFPMAAPLGGSLMILSWVGLAVAFALARE